MLKRGGLLYAHAHGLGGWLSAVGTLPPRWEALQGIRRDRHAAKYFIPLWLVAALINMWVGVSRAGYTVAQETPILLIVFAIPSAVALFIWWRFSRG